MEINLDFGDSPPASSLEMAGQTLVSASLKSPSLASWAQEEDWKSTGDATVIRGPPASLSTSPQCLSPASFISPLSLQLPFL